MLTDKDLQAIDRLIQKRVELTEKRMTLYMNLRFNNVQKELTKLFNFLDKDLITLKKRVKKLEDQDTSFS